MQAQRRRDTACELALRRELHARGLRYRVACRVIPGLRRDADVVFTRARVAVFVDGCFWHGCSTHRAPSKTNAAWWAAKIARNVARDCETNARLLAAGWDVVRVWEHTAPGPVAREIARIVVRRVARKTKPSLHVF